MSLPLFVPLATLQQIEQSPSSQDGVSKDLESHLRAYGCRLIHEAGLLLRQKQVAVGTAQVLFQRFWFVSSLKQYAIGDTAMGALYLASKIEECSLRIRDLVNVYDLILKRSQMKREQWASFRYTPMSFYSDQFYTLKDAIVVAEMQLLKRLGFNVHVVLPHATLVNYLRVMGLTGSDFTEMDCTDIMYSLHTTSACIYASTTLACAAILLATRHLDVALPKGWCRLFDADEDDVLAVAGTVMQLYQPSKTDVPFERLLSKAELRKWIEKNEVEN